MRVENGHVILDDSAFRHSNRHVIIKYTGTVPWTQLSDCFEVIIKETFKRTSLANMHSVLRALKWMFRKEKCYKVATYTT